MKHIILSLVILSASCSDLLAQGASRFMEITTIESVVSGGLGRSKMIISKDDGTAEEVSLENLFSIGGINFGNIKDNEKTILQTLKKYSEEGWVLISTSPLTLSPNQNSSGIFMTRYLLQKK